MPDIESHGARVLLDGGVLRVVRNYLKDVTVAARTRHRAPKSVEARIASVPPEAAATPQPDSSAREEGRALQLEPTARLEETLAIDTKPEVRA